MNDRIALFIATVCHSGSLPKAPGTWGSLAAALSAPFLFAPMNVPARLAVLIIVMAIGTWAANEAERVLDESDPGCVVIDELLGQWITYLPFAALGWREIILGFVLFRFFDILKPWPVKQTEDTFKGGLGVMLDDAVAGIYAAVCLGLLSIVV